jgi:hypothetical protein
MQPVLESKPETRAAIGGARLRRDQITLNRSQSHHSAPGNTAPPFPRERQRLHLLPRRPTAPRLPTPFGGISLASASAQRRNIWIAVARSLYCSRAALHCSSSLRSSRMMAGKRVSSAVLTNRSIAISSAISRSLALSTNPPNIRWNFGWPTAIAKSLNFLSTRALGGALVSYLATLPIVTPKRLANSSCVSPKCSRKAFIDPASCPLNTSVGLAIPKDVIINHVLPTA